MILRRKFHISLCVVLLALEISASVIKDALEEHLKDVAHNEDAEAIKHGKQKGEKVHHIENQNTDSQENQFSKANDEAKYAKKDYDVKSAAESDVYQGHTAQKDKAEDSDTSGFKRGHKKGHHNQGFQNSYHKDESSNKSTFFDDFNDEGDRAAYNSKINSHDNNGGRRYQGSHKNGQEYLRDNYHGGGYNKYGDSGNKNIHHQDYGKNYYLDDNADYNKYRKGYNSYDRGKIHDRHEYQPPVHRDPGWGWQRDNRRDWDNPGWQRDQGWQRDPEWDRDYDGPGYYDDHGLRHNGGYGYGPNHGFGYGSNHGYGYGESRTDPVAEVPKGAPVVAHRKQTITIYEDPRYDGKDNGNLRREEGDYLQLQYKPSSQRYAAYDDTYYNAPVREEGVQSSKINKLVYNYRRQ